MMKSPKWKPTNLNQPSITPLMYAYSDTLLSNGVWIVGVLVLGVLGIGAFMRTLTGRRWMDEVIFRTPLIGALSRKQEISRISLVIATLIESGLDLLRDRAGPVGQAQISTIKP